MYFILLNKLLNFNILNLNYGKPQFNFEMKFYIWKKIKTMKNFCLLLLSSILIISSCSNNDDNMDSSSASIIGKWNRYKVSYTLDNGEVEEVLWQHKCSTKKDYIEFRENQTYEPIEYLSNCEIHTAHGGGGFWRTENNIIYMSSNSEFSDEEQAEILVLNNSTLKVKYYDNNGWSTIEYIKN